MTFALVGNQNCGKTTLFNQLTGANAHVGNFPGVTVDSMVGTLRSDRRCTVVDLPGIYSIRPYTREEIVTRDFILQEHPDGIINIVDATNPERNLYLTLQLAEMNVPMVLALNMMDEVRANGGSIDVRALSERLGIPVIPISAAKNEGVNELIAAALETAEKKQLPRVKDFCTVGAVHRCIHAVSHQVEDHAAALGISARFAATKLVEGDTDIIERLKLSENELEMAEHSITEMESEVGLDRNAALADMRYTFIENACAGTVKRPAESREYRRSVKLDKILTGKYTALPVFILVMATMFYLTFDVIGAALSDLLSLGIDALSAAIDGLLTAYGVNAVVHSLVVDGILAGVGGVLSFLPLIVTLFFFLSILEDTGYMARVAFVMDKPLRKIGLSGRSIVPMLIGFGCSVPAIMATRTLSSERDRRLTVMLVPFMSCTAKIPIYAVFVQAFFPTHRALVMCALYAGGIVVGIVVALIAKALRAKGGPMPFVMELPNYRMPSAKSVIRLLYDKTRDFVTRAFTVIFLATVVVWFLQSFDIRFNPVADSGAGMLAAIGKTIAPLFAPVGFGDWRLATALITGITAKETVVTTLSVLCGAGAGSVDTVLPALFPSVAAALSFLTFTLLYTPCVAAVAAIRRELGSFWRTAGVVLFQCTLAWVVALVVYRVALLIL